MGKESLDKIIVGITGGIGSGKSVVSRILRLNGFPVYDTDVEAKRIMQEDLIVRANLCEIAGNEVYDESGHLDKAYMSRCVFSDSVLRDSINRVVHKAVADDFHRFSSRSDSRIVFCESAILMTSGFFRFCDSIIFVDAPENIRIDRVMARNNMSRDDVKKRIEAQMDEFMNLPDGKTFVVDNDGSRLILPLIFEFINNV